jgi:3-phosphoshikimate 1-carboxyvinyltransferase
VAALGTGLSDIAYPLDSLDARSCAAVCRGLGAEIREFRAKDLRCPNPPDMAGERMVRWTVRGIQAGGRPLRFPPGEDGGALSLDVGNSGTTLFLALAVAALGSGAVVFTGDDQIRRRSAGPLLEALRGLGVRAEAQGDGCVPILIQGPWRGGRVSLPCPTSQYLSALLLAAPLASAGTLTEIQVSLLNEKPYITMTLGYLKAQGVPFEAAADYSWFRIPGGASYGPQNGPIPGDFSSAAFPACAALVSGGKVSLLGLDPEDSQGDKAFFAFLQRMGCGVRWTALPGEGGAAQWRLDLSREGPLLGGEFDLNDTPDLLPVMAVLGAYAQGETALMNAAHARIKETDRIAVMAAELGKLGVHVEERPDGLRIRGPGGPPPGGFPVFLESRGDHRVAMALASAALGAAGPVEIGEAECAAVTYPDFLGLTGAEMAG